MKNLISATYTRLLEAHGWAVPLADKLAKGYPHFDIIGAYANVQGTVITLNLSLRDTGEKYLAELIQGQDGSANQWTLYKALENVLMFDEKNILRNY